MDKNYRSMKNFHPILENGTLVYIILPIPNKEKYRDTAYVVSHLGMDVYAVYLPKYKRTRHIHYFNLVKSEYPSSILQA